MRFCVELPRSLRHGQWWESREKLKAAGLDPNAEFDTKAEIDAFIAEALAKTGIRLIVSLSYPRGDFQL